jgi:hypothetical protein
MSTVCRRTAVQLGQKYGASSQQFDCKALRTCQKDSIVEVSSQVGIAAIDAVLHKACTHKERNLIKYFCTGKKKTKILAVH